MVERRAARSDEELHRGPGPRAQPGSFTQPGRSAGADRGAEKRTKCRPVPQTLVRTNPVNGRMSVYVSAHATHIVGWPVEQGRALLRELTEFATKPKFGYRHVWRAGDLVVWNNR